MKNLIYAGTNTSNSVVAGAVVPISTIEKKFNRCNACSSIDLTGNVVTIRTNSRRPRYNGWAKITFTGATTGNAVLGVYLNGTQIPFAVGSETIGTATTEVHNVVIPFSILTNCCSTNTISIVNTGTIGLTVTNASILVVED